MTRTWTKTSLAALCASLLSTVTVLASPASATEAEPPPAPWDEPARGLASLYQNATGPVVDAPLHTMSTRPVVGGGLAAAATTTQDCYFEANYSRFNKSEDGTAGMTPATTGYHTFFTEGELRDVGYIGGDQSSWWTSDIGTRVQVVGPGIQSIKVFFDWSYEGEWYASSQYSEIPVNGGFSQSSAKSSLIVDLRRNGLTQPSTVHTRTVSGSWGVPQQAVASYAGVSSKTVGAADGDIIESVTRMRGDLTTQTASLTTARAYLDFDNPPDGWGVYGPFGQRWQVTLADGYVLDCGN